MSTFFMFGKYSSDAFKGMSAKRTAEATKIINIHGGEVKSMYALLGENDLAFIIEFPGNNQAMKAAVALSKATGISFYTAPAVTVVEFDKLLEEI